VPVRQVWTARISIACSRWCAPSRARHGSLLQHSHLNESQAERLKDAGHRITIISTLRPNPGNIIPLALRRPPADLAHVRKAGITVCCGGILGMGESDERRIGLLHELSRLNPHPESVPNQHARAEEGTPIADVKELQTVVMVRHRDCAVLMPASRVRLAAGRRQLSPEAVTLCFLAGANSSSRARTPDHSQPSGRRPATPRESRYEGDAECVKIETGRLERV